MLKATLQITLTEAFLFLNKTKDGGEENNVIIYVCKGNEKPTDHKDDGLSWRVPYITTIKLTGDNNKRNCTCSCAHFA